MAHNGHAQATGITENNAQDINGHVFNYNMPNLDVSIPGGIQKRRGRKVNRPPQAKPSLAPSVDFSLENIAKLQKEDVTLGKIFHFKESLLEKPIGREFRC